VAEDPEFQIKNWKQFQHYLDGRPMRWVKLHTSLLDDCEFSALPEITQLQLIKLWLAAGEKAGALPNRAQAEFRIRSKSKVNWALLEESGFLVRNRTNPYQTSRADKIRVEEIREENTLGQQTALTEVVLGDKRLKWDQFFDRWWKEGPTPRKVAKNGGRKAWMTLIPKKTEDLEARFQRILTVTAARWSEWEKREPDKRPHPATFLRSEEF